MLQAETMEQENNQQKLPLETLIGIHMIATQNCTIKQFPKVYQNLSNNQVKQQ